MSAQTNELNSCLFQIENQNEQIKNCRLHQVLPDECDSYLHPSILLTLQCAKYGATKQQINRAIQQGENKLSGDSSKSPYQQIRKRITSGPFFIQPEKENYIAYSSQCSEFKDKLFRIAAQAINDGQAKFIVSPMKPMTCMPTTNLNKKYPILTKEQLELFRQGYYLDQQASAERTYENIEVMVADSLAQAGEFFSRMKERVRLTIDTEPKNSRVKIIGMKRAYKKGMKLNVGRYKIRVTSPTYTPRELTIDLEKDNNTFTVNLESSIEQIACYENQQNFPVEFTNRNYLKKLNNCTYQLITNTESGTPFKLLVVKNAHRSKHLVKARLGILNSELSGNSLLSIEVLTPRQTKIAAGSSGISDVPDSITKNLLNKTTSRLTILDATFSH